MATRVDCSGYWCAINDMYHSRIVELLPAHNEGAVFSMKPFPFPLLLIIGGQVLLSLWCTILALPEKGKRCPQLNDLPSTPFLHGWCHGLGDDVTYSANHVSGPFRCHSLKPKQSQ